jgi:membrane associated rhomboid family serine protease
MATCDVCGEQVSLPYRCRGCGGTFCAEHRLPENHACPGLDDWNDPGGVFDSGFDDSVNQGDSESIASRLTPDTGRGGLLAYFRGNITYLLLALMWVTFLAQNVVGILSPGLFRPLFVLTPTHPEYVWTWVTSIFAHGGFGHIALNSIVLYFFGPVVEDRIGSDRFLAMFLFAGALAGLSQILVGIALGDPGPGVVGASGAIAAAMGVLTVLNPHLRIYLYFIIPMPLWMATALFAGYSVFASTVGGVGAGNVAQIAHLAGLAVGVIYGYKLKREGERAPQQLQFGGPGGPGGPGRRR